VGPTKLLDDPGRAFFYNFHTLPEYRGRGLYTLLLVYMKQTLTAEGRSEFIIDVNEANVPSFRGIIRAGFEPIARVAHVNLFRRWRVPLAKVMLDKSGMRVFA
jgi:ribosomal protein S18 acetylase RimI-like enzyme